MLSDALVTFLLLTLSLLTNTATAEPARLDGAPSRRLSKSPEVSIEEPKLTQLSTNDTLTRHGQMKGVLRLSNGLVSGYLVQNVYEPPSAFRTDNQQSFFRKQKWHGVYEISSDISRAVNFTLPSTECGNLPNVFEIGAEGPFSEDAPTYPLLGIGSSLHDQFGYDLGSTKKFGGLGSLTNANSSAANTFEKSGTTQSYLRSESTIWSMDCETKEITATWTTFKKKQVPVHFMGTGTHSHKQKEVTQGGVIRVVTDIKKYDATYYPNLKTPSTPFQLFFVPHTSL